MPHTVRYHKYHANEKLLLEQLADFDIIFTTYHTLNLEYARGGSPLFSAEWFRVILDEGIRYIYGVPNYRMVTNSKGM